MRAAIYIVVGLLLIFLFAALINVFFPGPDFASLKSVSSFFFGLLIGFVGMLNYLKKVEF